jgi:glycosyltransferase involved in cell wall biosynthesis
MMKSLLLLSTITRGHAAHSGYQQLAVHLPEARFVHTIREEPASALPRLGFRVVRRLSFSRWYLSSCVALEAQAWREVRRGFSGIVHSMWADHDLGFLDLLLDRRRHRLVGSFHCCDDTFTIRFPRRLRSFDAIILMSRTQESFFLNAGVDPNRIHVVPHGVDTEYFRPGTPARKLFVVLAAGWYRRNFPLLREVCLGLKNEADLRFEIVAPEGWRWLFADLPNARFRSGLSDAEFLDAYQTCSCVLQTVENATANNVILEAMACGQPVVAETIGGIPEYIDPTCAILTAPGQADALAAALLELKASPRRRDALAVGARKRAEMLDWKNIAGRMREIYERLAGEL